MSLLRRIIVLIVGITLFEITAIVAMIYGWGCPPKSWPIIIGVGFCGQFFAIIVMELATYRRRKIPPHAHGIDGSVLRDDK